jgi:hypothetical protein
MGGHSDDRRLGMHRPITRRDFLDGVAIAAGAAASKVALNGPLPERRRIRRH